jgi:transposase-like protein
MKATNTIANEVKLNIAVAAIENNTSVKELAVEFGVSESTVKRAKVAFAEAAKAAIEAKNKPKKAKRTKAVEVETSGVRGFKPRNGRVTIIKSMIPREAEFASFNELWEEFNNICVANGLTKMNKNSFRAMFTWRKKNPTK